MKTESLLHTLPEYAYLKKSRRANSILHQVCYVKLFLVAVGELDFPEAVRAIVLVARRKALDGAAVRLVSAGGGDENLGYDPPDRHLGVALDLR